MSIPIQVLCPFLNGVLGFLLLSFRCSPYSLTINPYIWFVNIFSHSLGCLFTLLVVSFDEQKCFNYHEVQFVFSFLTCVFGIISKKIIAKSNVVKLLLTVFFFFFFFFFFFCLFAISWATPTAYGGSQARGRIGAIATGLRQNHSNAGSEPHLQPTPQLMATRILNPLSKGRDQICVLMDPSQVHYHWATIGTLRLSLKHRALNFNEVSFVSFLLFMLLASLRKKQKLPNSWPQRFIPQHTYLFQE